MKTGIHVGHSEESKVALDAAGDAITKILNAGFHSRSDQSTIVEALQALGRVASIGGMTIQGATVINNPKKAPKKVNPPTTGWS